VRVNTREVLCDKNTHMI